MNRVHKSDYRVILDVLSSLDCSRSLTVAIMLKYGEFDQIVNLGFEPRDFNDINQAALSLQATELLRKADFLPTTFSKDELAAQSFLAAEETCGSTNLRLGRERNAHAGVLFSAQRKIAQVLGEFCPDEWIDSSGWGPGVTLLLKGRNANAFEKFAKKAEVTMPLYRLLKPIWHAAFPCGKWQPDFKLVEGNKVIQVPKTSKINRTIAIEPSINLFFQKGCGSMIRNRLARVSVNLRDQTINQSLAKEGSKSGSLTTIDFSSASDTVSYGIVKDLLPFTWFQVLDALRSPRGLHQGSLLEYEKFSSMGNGFTFELESLIFWAIAKAVVPETHPLYESINIYGDDLIVPAGYEEALSSVFAFCGFTINMKKSHSSTYYRESCGKHYWNGVDISPFYMRSSCGKDSLSNPTCMKLHNRLIEWSVNLYGFVPFKFRGVLTFLRDSSKVTNPIPIGYGDLGLISSFDQATPRYDKRKWLGWGVTFLSVKSKVKVSDGIECLLTRLLYRSNEQPLGNECELPRTGRMSFIKTYVPHWPDITYE